MQAATPRQPAREHDRTQRRRDHDHERNARSHLMLERDVAEREAGQVDAIDRVPRERVA